MYSSQTGTTSKVLVYDEQRKVPDVSAATHRPVQANPAYVSPGRRRRAPAASSANLRIVHTHGDGRNKKDEAKRIRRPICKAEKTRNVAFIAATGLSPSPNAKNTTLSRHTQTTSNIHTDHKAAAPTTNNKRRVRPRIERVELVGDVIMIYGCPFPFKPKLASESPPQLARETPTSLAGRNTARSRSLTFDFQVHDGIRTSFVCVSWFTTT